MRSFSYVAFSVLAVTGCVDDEVLVATPVEAAAHSPLRDAYAGCFPRTSELLVRADDELAHDATLDAQRDVASAQRTFVEEDSARHCPTDAYERVRARTLLLRGLVARASHASDIDALLSLGDDSFQTSHCEADVASRCAEHASFLRARFPQFANAYEIRLSPLFRLPITPQPDGRLTVEYMTYVQTRLDALDADFVAFSIEPSSTTAIDSHVELHVDGVDVREGRELKTAAHVVMRVPVTDITRAHGAKAFVVVFSRNALVHDETTWRVAEARVAFGQP